MGEAGRSSGAGTTRVSATGTMTVTGNSSNRFLDTGTLRIDGTANWTGTTITYLQDGATIEIGPGAPSTRRSTTPSRSTPAPGRSTCWPAGR